MNNKEIPHKYTKEFFLTTPFEILYRKWIRGMRLLVDITFKPPYLGGEPKYNQTEKWTDMDPDEIHAIGYREAVGLHDSIVWWGVPIYVRIHNDHEFPIAEIYPEKKDTAYTINDAMLSNTERDFKRGLMRAQLTATADWQKLFLIGIIGAGIILGTKMMGFW